MPFDPYKYGAKPIGAKAAATAIPSSSDSGFPKSEPEEVKRNFFQKTASFLGIEKFGQGIAGAIRTQTGEVGADIQAQDQQSQDAMKLVELAKKTPDLARKKKLLKMAMEMGATIDPEEIDPTLKLSNKEILGSALNVATTVIGAGSAPGTKFAGKLSKVPGLRKGVSVSEKIAPKLPGVFKGSKTAARVVEGAALGYSSDVGQKASENKDKAFKPSFGTAAGVSIPVVSKALGALTRRTLGITTGAGNPVIKRAIENPDEVTESMRRYAKDESSKIDLVERAKTAIQGYLGGRNTEFGANVSKTTFNKPFPKQEVVSEFANQLKKFNGKITKDGVTFNSTQLTAADQANLNKFFNELKTWKDFTPSGVENLRQAIGNHISEFKATGNTRADVVLGGLKKFVTQGLEDRAPGYKGNLAEYGRKTGLANDVLSELNLKSENTKTSTKINSIMRLFKKDPDVIKKLTEAMGEQESNKLLNDISGALLSELLPHGSVRAIVEGNLSLIGLWQLISGGISFPAFAAAISSASPRIVGEVSTKVGKGIKKGVGTGLRRAATKAASKFAK